MSHTSHLREPQGAYKAVKWAWDHYIKPKWSPIAGLLGQPAWLYFAWQAQGWGLMCLCTAYTLVYIQGIRVQWGRA